MSNKFQEVDIKKSYICYLYIAMINVKNLDSNKIQRVEKSYKHVLVYYIGYLTVANLSYIKINSVNPLTLLSIK